MIEKFLEQLIKELGPTGLLVVGLYLILACPLKHMVKSLENINKELGEIRDCIKAEIKDSHGKT